MPKTIRPVQLYMAFVWLLGSAVACLAVKYAWATHFFADTERVVELSLFMIASAFAFHRKIPLMRKHTSNDHGSISIGFITIFAALFQLGPLGALFTGAIGALFGSLYPIRCPRYQIAFNVSIIAVAAWATSFGFIAIQPLPIDQSNWTLIEAVFVAATIYYLINSTGVATVIALSSAQSPLRLWQEKFVWLAPGYFAASAISALAVLLVSSLEHFKNSSVSLGMVLGAAPVIMLLLVLPIAALAFAFYQTYLSREEERKRHVEKLESLIDSSVQSLALAIDAKDQYTHQHILRVQRYAMATARVLGVTGDDLEGLDTGALLHDIGKVGIPEYILLKPGRLTPEEFDKIKKHPEIGADILAPVEFPWPVIPVVKYHHEKWDGTGYPEGLKGEDIPLTARILAVADVYDALTSARPYRNAWTHARAIETIKKDTGSHFDPMVARAFLQIIDNTVAQVNAELSADDPNILPGLGMILAGRSDQATRDIQRAAAELWALYEVAQTLSSNLGVQDTLEMLGRKLETIFPDTTCLFLMRLEGTDDLVTQVVVGPNSHVLLNSRAVNPGSVTRKVASQREFYLGDYEEEDLQMVNPPDESWLPLRSALIVPMAHQGEIMGTLNLYRPMPNFFGNHDRQLLQAIAERAAAAVSHGQLLDRARGQSLTDPADRSIQSALGDASPDRPLPSGAAWSGCFCVAVPGSCLLQATKRHFWSSERGSSLAYRQPFVS